MGIERGAANTIVGAEMKKEGMGACSANLYAQFIYRLLQLRRQYGLTHCFLGLFTPTLFFTGSSFKQLRQQFYKDFHYYGGVQFRASEFADVKDSWAISFTVWGPGETDAIDGLPFDLIRRAEGGRVEVFGNIRLHNLDNKVSLGDWIRGRQPLGEDFPTVNFSSAINVSAKALHPGRHGMLGSIINSSNNVDQNATGVSLYSGVGAKGGNGIIYIGEENFSEACAFYAVKKLIACDWINSKSEYMAPDESHDSYAEFLLDSVVFSIFHTSQQASLRHVEFNGAYYDIHNEFFFMSRDEMAELANTNGNSECWNDARTDRDRRAFLLLSSARLSDEAAALIGKARRLVASSFEFRSLFDMEHPEYQINCWDAGWYQIKALLKEYDKRGLEEFNSLFKALADKMRPMVYELGFLK